MSLSAAGLPTVAPFSAYFANGINTSLVGRAYLPFCVPYGRGPFVHLNRTDTGAVLFSDAPIRYFPHIDFALSLYWNFTMHPTLVPRLSGTYQCSTATALSLEKYTLNVVGKRANFVW